MTDPFGRCPATTKLYEVQGEDARCRHGSAEHRRDEQAGLESTDNPVYLDLSHLGDGTVQCVRNLAHPGNRLS